ncbi:MAG: sulfite oxidase heme-binding subunit YedZ [Lautropia sp.]
MLLERGLKPLVFVCALLPLARLVLLGYHDALGANPVEAVTRSTGFWTLTMLCIALAVTPLRRLAGWPDIARLRRMLGLFAFFYACLHLTTWVWFDQWFELAGMLADVLKRPFIAVGLAAFLLLVPLALTSTRAMMRRLGRNWQRLHRLVYLAAPLAVLHFWWDKAGKNDLAEPMLFAAVVAVLLVFRIVGALHRAAIPARAEPAGRGAGGGRAPPR